MINRLHRFHGHNALKGVYQHGNTVRGPIINLKYLHRSDKPYRAAVVVSKKVHKSAVVRNRIRRRIYEICRKQKTVDIRGVDLVFTVFSDQTATIEHEKLEKYIIDLLKKVA